MDRRTMAVVVEAMGGRLDQNCLKNANNAAVVDAMEAGSKTNTSRTLATLLTAGSEAGLGVGESVSETGRKKKRRRRGKRSRRREVRRRAGND